MGKMKDLTGQRFGRLVAVEFTVVRVRGCVMWLCICDCGRPVNVSSERLIVGSVKSCGCLLKESGRLKLIQAAVRRRKEAEERISTGTKKCSNCNYIKKISDFYKSKRSLDGRCSQCKSCAYTLKISAANIKVNL